MAVDPSMMGGAPPDPGGGGPGGPPGSGGGAPDPLILGMLAKMGKKRHAGRKGKRSKTRSKKGRR